MIALSIATTDPDDRCGTEPREPEAVARLRPLLAAVAVMDLDDKVAWAALLRVAWQTTTDLAAQGELPRHLTVDPDDPPVLATRTIAAAWKHATGTPRTRPRG